MQPLINNSLDSSESSQLQSLYIRENSDSLGKLPFIRLHDLTKKSNNFEKLKNGEATTYVTMPDTMITEKDFVLVKNEAKFRKKKALQLK